MVEEAPAKWSLMQAFYVTMNGVALDPGTAPRLYLEGEQHNVCRTLGEEEILETAKARPELLSQLSLSHIKDKSKTDSLAKALVFIQALWFIVQCIFRLAGQSMAISLLEVWKTHLRA